MILPHPRRRRCPSRLCGTAARPPNRRRGCCSRMAAGRTKRRVVGMAPRTRRRLPNCLTARPAPFCWQSFWQNKGEGGGVKNSKRGAVKSIHKHDSSKKVQKGKKRRRKSCAAEKPLKRVRGIRRRFKRVGERLSARLSGRTHFDSVADAKPRVGGCQRGRSGLRGGRRHQKRARRNVPWFYGIDAFVDKITKNIYIYSNNK